MSQEDLIKRSLVAVLKGTTVGAALVTTYAKGCTGARTGVGVITLTLDPSPSYDANIDSTQSSMEITPYTTALVMSIADTSGTTKTISIFTTAAAAAEGAFEARIYRVFPS